MSVCTCYRWATGLTAAAAGRVAGLDTCFSLAASTAAALVPLPPVSQNAPPCLPFLYTPLASTVALPSTVVSVCFPTQLWMHTVAAMPQLLASQFAGSMCRLGQLSSNCSHAHHCAVLGCSCGVFLSPSVWHMPVFLPGSGHGSIAVTLVFRVPSGWHCRVGSFSLVERCAACLTQRWWCFAVQPPACGRYNDACPASSGSLPTLHHESSLVGMVGMGA